LWIIPASAGGANRSSAVFLRYRSFVAATRGCHPERGFYAQDLNCNALRQFPLGACHPESPFVDQMVLCFGPSCFVIPGDARNLLFPGCPQNQSGLPVFRHSLICLTSWPSFSRRPPSSRPGTSPWPHAWHWQPSVSSQELRAQRVSPRSWPVSSLFPFSWEFP
jgi:hypothetical protein